MHSFIDLSSLFVSREFGLNTDILETNIINIAILVFGLFNFVGDILKTSLDERKQKIIESVEASENRLNEAQLRFDESQKQLEQVQLIVSEIQAETTRIKSEILAREFSQTSEQIEKQFTLAARVIQDREQIIVNRILRQIVQYILFQAFRMFIIMAPISGNQKSLNDSLLLLKV